MGLVAWNNFFGWMDGWMDKRHNCRLTRCSSVHQSFMFGAINSPSKGCGWPLQSTLWEEHTHAHRQKMMDLLSRVTENLAHVCLLHQRHEYKQESRAIAGRTARCCCEFRYVPNFTTASCSFPAYSIAFLLVFVCRLQWIICQKEISTRKNQSDRIGLISRRQVQYITWPLSISIIIIHRQHNDSNKQNA